MTDTGWKNAEVEDDPRWLLHTPDGRTMREADVSITYDQWKRMWQGYTCAWCGEPWTEQWPARCTLIGCWSPDMSEEVQRQYMLERYGGEKWLGISKETAESLVDSAERAAWQKKTGIWLPGQ